jgi:hypothetical protein
MFRVLMRATTLQNVNAAGPILELITRFTIARQSIALYLWTRIALGVIPADKLSCQKTGVET